MKDINFLTSNGVDVKSSLDLFGDIGTYNDTLGEFINSAKEKIEKLENYKNEKDMANYSIYVHSLKSDSKYFGFTELAKLAEEQEEKSKVGDIFAIQEGFSTLQEATNKAVSVASEYLSGNVVENTKPVSTITPQVGEIYTTSTILVVDDSNIIRNFVMRSFKDKYGIGAAKNGQEAINIIYSNSTNNNIVAVLLDLNMPGVDGFAVLEYMKDNNLFNKIPVSIISGDSSKETIDRAFTYPIVDMLGKPFTEKDVKNILEKTILYKELQY